MFKHTSTAAQVLLNHGQRFNMVVRVLFFLMSKEEGGGNMKGEGEGRAS